MTSSELTAAPLLEVREMVVRYGRIGVFPGITVADNLEMGCYGRKFDSKSAHDEQPNWVPGGR